MAPLRGLKNEEIHVTRDKVPYMIIYGHTCPYLVIYGDIWSYMIINGHICPYMPIYAHIYPFMIIYGHMCPSMIIYVHIGPYICHTWPIYGHMNHEDICNEPWGHMLWTMRTHDMIDYQPCEGEPEDSVVRLDTARLATEFVTTTSSPVSSPHSGGSLIPKVSRDVPWVLARKRMSNVFNTRFLWR